MVDIALFICDLWMARGGLESAQSVSLIVMIFFVMSLEA